MLKDVVYILSMSCFVTHYIYLVTNKITRQSLSWLYHVIMDHYTPLSDTCCSSVFMSTLMIMSVIQMPLCVMIILSYRHLGSISQHPISCGSVEACLFWKLFYFNVKSKNPKIYYNPNLNICDKFQIKFIYLLNDYYLKMNVI